MVFSCCLCNFEILKDSDAILETIRCVFNFVAANISCGVNCNQTKDYRCDVNSNIYILYSSSSPSFSLDL